MVEAGGLKAKTIKLQVTGLKWWKLEKGASGDVSNTVTRCEPER